MSVHGSQKEKVELFKKLADCSRLVVVPKEQARDPFVSGLFCVGKSNVLDRLILDARPPNLLEVGKSTWCSSMASCSGLGEILLQPDEDLCCSGLDLKDFFYQFVVGGQRIIRNTLAGTVTPAEASYIFGTKFSEEEGEVRVALATLAMGDLLACEFSQSAHLALCLRCGVLQPSELLTLRTPVPRGKVITGVIIDDLVVMERLLKSTAADRTHDVEGACPRIKAAIDGYERNKLEANIKKSFFNETTCRFWGGEIDGAAGLVRASSFRAWPLVVISMKVANLGYASVKLLETLAGAWISVLTMRRRMFCLLDIIFEPLGISDGNQVVALSPALQDELCALCCTFLLAAADLRADFLPMVSATDASCERIAAVRAHLPKTCAAEFARFSLKKGTWSRLLPPGRAALRSKGKLDPADELPGLGLVSHPLWSILARGLWYEEVWVAEVFGQPHINLLELKAFLKEEKRLCGLHQQKRCLSALDSQVCLGALVKGRSSSPSINRALRCSLAYPLGASFHNYFMYFLSEENRADGPSRHKKPDPPDVSVPSWFDEVQRGDFDSFDAWLGSLGPDYSLAPFDFSELDNSGKIDIRPRSHLSGKERRRECQGITKLRKKKADEEANPEALPFLASTAGFVSSDGVAVTGNTKSTPTVGIREPFQEREQQGDMVQKFGVPAISRSHPADSAPTQATSSTTTNSKTSFSTNDEALPSPTTARFVPSDSAVALGRMTPSCDDGVREPFEDHGDVKIALSILESFPLDQFVFGGDAPDFTRAGAIDLFSGCRGVAKAMVDAGAPWILTFDIDRGVSQDLLDDKLREKIRRLLKSGLVKSVGMAPICASFSKAVTPPVRSRKFPRGKPGLSKTMVAKVRAGNSHCDFCGEIIQLCQELRISYFLENPDSSWMWKQRGYESYDDPGSLQVFRLCFCRFGTPWRKATRIATSTRLRGLRMMCKCEKKHFPLRGFSRVHKKMWTKVAEPYPRGLARLLAISLCCQAGWCEQKRLNVAACSRARTLRPGEATNPGPRAHRADRGTLEDLPLLSGHTQALEAKQLSLFVEWCKRSIKSMEIDELFDKVPAYVGQCLRCYGDTLYQHGGALSNYRHCILALQRWKPLCRPYMHGPWELVRRWEFQEPVNHRPPTPEGVVKGLVALAWQFEWYDWCGVTLISFYGAGRLGEVIRCLRKDLIMPCDTIGEINHSCYLELRRFKSLYRQSSKIQHMKINDRYCVKLLTMIYGKCDGDDLLFSGSSDQYRRRWDFLLKSFAVDPSLKLTPGGLRGGAAVWAYRRGVPITQIQWNLRLRHQGTLESYIQETASLTIFSSLSPGSRTSFQRAALVFDWLHSSANRQGGVSTP